MSLNIPELKLLILAGGKSTRMGSPKHLLTLPDERPLYLHLVDILQQACPEADTVYISLAQEPASYPKTNSTLMIANSLSQRDCGSAIHSGVLEGRNLKTIYDLQQNFGNESAGPAEGLLAAHSFSPTSTWLIVACDFPFLTVDMIQQLRSSYQSPVTCFKNDEGFCEPLLGIWSSAALQHLANNLVKGLRSPSKTVSELGGKLIQPLHNPGISLFNANTREDWYFVLQELDSKKNSSIHLN